LYLSDQCLSRKATLNGIPLVHFDCQSGHIMSNSLDFDPLFVLFFPSSVKLYDSKISQFKELIKIEYKLTTGFD